MQIFRELSAFFDQRCRICGRLGSVTGHNPFQDLIQGVCFECGNTLMPKNIKFCRLCSLPLTGANFGPELCNRCMIKPPVWNEIQALGLYKGLLRQLVLDLKFHSALHIASTLGELLAVKYARKLNRASALVVPVPLHTQRLKTRGYNQSLELARPIAKRLGIKIGLHNLFRVRSSPPQESLGRKEREKAVKGVFSVSGDISGVHILLVDDVLTTGATLNECVEVLFAAGAARVSVAVAARTGIE